MNPQHLSDEAVAAFADGVLRGHARERAVRHADACAECRDAVRSQREAVLALRSAPAPALPGGLFERLCAVPSTTPLPPVPDVFSGPADPATRGFRPMTHRHSPMSGLPLGMAALAPVAPLVPPNPASRTASGSASRSGSRVPRVPGAKPFATGAAVLVLAAGTLAAGATLRQEPAPVHGDGVVNVRVGGGEQAPVTPELVGARFSRR